MLQIPKRFCDGAATCALLAAECALKAMLLYGHQAKTHEEIPEVIRKSAFESKAGHNLVSLWSYQAASIRQQGGKAQTTALTLLHKLDRYQHRYGLKRPDRSTAKDAVAAASTLVQWMQAVVLEGDQPHAR